MQTYVLFLLFCAIAVYAQVMTGFALALIFLGLIGATDIVPLPDAVNAVTVIIIINSCIFLYRRRALHLNRELWSALFTSLAGAVAGIALLTWLAGSSYQVLRIILGVSIILCALLLWRTAKPLERTSGQGAFLSAGSLAGVLGGMFAAPGPPLVYIMYRQPWPMSRIQESLIFLFGAGSVLRLAIVAFSGQFTPESMRLTLIATPVVILVTWVAAHQKLPFSAHVMKNIVSVLLIASGTIMCASAISILMH
ncbi:sulfite exporter TauE/SafE family protein [Candidimonas humi]|uniref:Probable membrane transporter protein n=1 Tax=Candidimonas humi TaxID=683355 RepID=A0ABV8NWN1_9BURK|nr:sulfite exporter TauE/SafE family protein [Candidimonas humi]MBV6304653.1 sulfite exporter TauE/SafE family protein [Candidimonas humi]